MGTQQQDFRVYKFGGSSVADAAAFERVATWGRRVGGGNVFVVSAMGGITDLLLGAGRAAAAGNFDIDVVEQFTDTYIDAGNKLLKDPKPFIATVTSAATEFAKLCESLLTLGESTPKALDRISSRGEKLSAQLLTYLLNDIGLDSVCLEAEALIHMKTRQGTLVPDMEKIDQAVNENLAPLLASQKIVIIPGFIGVDESGDLVTLGRGGTDFSAALIAASVGARELVLCKEVDGIMTADPRHVAEARVVPELHYREASELAYYGAKVLHPRTIIPLIEKNIPLIVRNTFRDDVPGTRIAGDVEPGAFPVKALTAIRNQALLSIEGKGMMGVPGIAGRTFQALAKNGISVSVISQASSEASICFAVDLDEAKKATQAIEDEFHFEIEVNLIDSVQCLTGQAVIAVVGLGMKGTPGISARTFRALGKAAVNIEAIAQGSSELNISVVVDEASVPNALGSLHREFRLEKLRALPHRQPGSVDLTIFGLGQIGRTLMGQIGSQHDYFKNKMGVTVNPVAFADTRNVISKPEGYSQGSVADLVGRKKSGLLIGDRREKLSLQDTINLLESQVFNHPFHCPVFADLTAAETFPLLQQAISHGWHIVVANKKPLAVPQKDFDELFREAKERELSIRYEATVGAGLPVLDTLAKLEEAGDEVITILGCLSGTLGYLMTELDDGCSFSEAVAKAYSQGYTEPDPREDLSGMDVARKALILARTLGYRLDMNDFDVEALFPEELSDDDPKVFVDNIKQMDKSWSERIAAANKQGKVLRYVARISPDQVSVGIEEVGNDSPLGRLRGTDNQINIRTRMYDTNPLIVTGPGAGAAVTAAGVLNDVLAVAMLSGHD